MTLGVLARLESQDNPACIDFVGIDNITSRGARVISTRRWLVQDTVMLTWLDRAWDPVQARVVYRHLLDDGRCALGLRFENPLPDLAFVHTT